MFTDCTLFFVYLFTIILILSIWFLLFLFIVHSNFYSLVYCLLPTIIVYFSLFTRPYRIPILTGLYQSFRTNRIYWMLPYTPPNVNTGKGLQPVEQTLGNLRGTCVCSVRAVCTVCTYVKYCIDCVFSMYSMWSIVCTVYTVCTIVFSTTIMLHTYLCTLYTVCTYIIV